MNAETLNFPEIAEAMFPSSRALAAPTLTQTALAPLLAIEQEAVRLVAITEAQEAEFDKAIVAREDEIAAEKAEAARIEAQRIEQARVAAEQAETQRKLDEQAADIKRQADALAKKLADGLAEQQRLAAELAAQNATAAAPAPDAGRGTEVTPEPSKLEASPNTTTSPVGGPMGTGQPAAAGPVGDTYLPASAAAVPPEDDDGEDLYLRLMSLSKALESSGRIDEHDYPDAYATLLDAMNFVRAAGEKQQ